MDDKISSKNFIESIPYDKVNTDKIRQNKAVITISME